jgi:hypothetical protein
VWALHGTKTSVGKDAFAAEADSGDGPNPDLTLDLASRPQYSEVFPFAGGLVSRLDTFHIWLGERHE